MNNNLQKKADIVLKTLKKLYPDVKPALDYSTPLEFLIAVILSAQCTDIQVNKVTAILFKKYKKMQDYCNVSLEEFEQDIKSIGLYKGKAKNILQTVKIIQEQYKGIIPDTLEVLVTLPGVGRKTANVVLGEIYKTAVGIAVDTHVKRLTQLYRLTIHDNPEKIEQDLMKLIPQTEWSDFTLRLIEYGREYCPARKHNHVECPLTIALK